MGQEDCHIVAFGNEKGGTGKSTLAMHVVIALMDAGRRVVVVDLDTRQRSLSRYIENRQRFSAEQELGLSVPKCVVADTSNQSSVEQRDFEDTRHLQALVDQLRIGHDVVVIDCPGNHTRLSEVAHSLADTLVTPINDSFVDLDLIGKIHPETFQAEEFSHYTKMVWESRKNRSIAGRQPMDWVVARNRMSIQQAKNKQRVHYALKQLEKRCNFRYVSGLSERVIYRELFPIGLTLLDYPKVPALGRMSMSHVAARQEVRQLMDDLKLLQVREKEVV